MTQEEKDIIVNEVLDRIKDHKHTGLDSLKIDPRDFEGFKVYTSAPTTNTYIPDGTPYFYYDGAVINHYMYYGGEPILTN